MTLLKGRRVAEDRWIALADDAPLPAAGPVIVGWDRWRAEHDTLRARVDPVGVRIAGDQALEPVVEALPELALIEVVFPSFRDGRGFSTGRLLRERYRFPGELRASGPLIPDQARFLERCGYDAVALADDVRLQDWLACYQEIDLVYQPAADGARTIADQRQGQGRGADA